MTNILRDEHDDAAFSGFHDFPLSTIYVSKRTKLQSKYISVSTRLLSHYFNSYDHKVEKPKWSSTSYGVTHECRTSSSTGNDINCPYRLISFITYIFVWN
jgi:hypothetical protein